MPIFSFYYWIFRSIQEHISFSFIFCVKNFSWNTFEWKKKQSKSGIQMFASNHSNYAIKLLFACLALWGYKEWNRQKKDKNAKKCALRVRNRYWFFCCCSWLYRWMKNFHQIQQIKTQSGVVKSFANNAKTKMKKTYWDAREHVWDCARLSSYRNGRWN